MLLHTVILFRTCVLQAVGLQESALTDVPAKLRAAEGLLNGVRMKVRPEVTSPTEALWTFRAGVRLVIRMRAEVAPEIAAGPKSLRALSADEGLLAGV